MCSEGRRYPRYVDRSHPTARVARAGFTLIELMIVVVVVAILAVVVLPSYQSYVQKARRTDAKSALTSAAQMLERFATENPTKGFSTATLGTGGVFADRSENGHYTLTLPVKEVSRFTLRATPRDAQANDACKSFTLDHSGTRGVADTSKSAEECWQ